MFYPSDLTDAEWQIIEPLLPPDKPVGRPPTVSLRAVLDAIFYRADNGIKWRAMPIDFPPWQTVYTYYRRWVRLGVWEQINATLVERVRSEVRSPISRLFTPTALQNSTAQPPQNSHFISPSIS